MREGHQTASLLKDPAILDLAKQARVKDSELEAQVTGAPSRLKAALAFTAVQDKRRSTAGTLLEEWPKAAPDRKAEIEKELTELGLLTPAELHNYAKNQKLVAELRQQWGQQQARNAHERDEIASVLERIDAIQKVQRGDFSALSPQQLERLMEQPSWFGFTFKNAKNALLREFIRSKDDPNQDFYAVLAENWGKAKTDIERKDAYERVFDEFGVSTPARESFFNGELFQAYTKEQMSEQLKVWKAKEEDLKGHFNAQEILQKQIEAAQKELEPVDKKQRELERKFIESYAEKAGVSVDDLERTLGSLTRATERAGLVIGAITGPGASDPDYQRKLEDFLAPEREKALAELRRVFGAEADKIFTQQKEQALAQRRKSDVESRTLIASLTEKKEMPVTFNGLSFSIGQPPGEVHQKTFDKLLSDLDKASQGLGIAPQGTQIKGYLADLKLAGAQFAQLPGGATISMENAGRALFLNPASREAQQGNYFLVSAEHARTLMKQASEKMTQVTGLQDERAKLGDYSFYGNSGLS